MGSPKFSLSWQEASQVLWVSLLFAVAQFAYKLVELGNGLAWGDLAPLWAVVAAGIVWLVKRFVTDTEPPAKPRKKL